MLPRGVRCAAAVSPRRPMERHHSTATRPHNSTSSLQQSPRGGAGMGTGRWLDQKVNKYGWRDAMRDVKLQRTFTYTELTNQVKYYANGFYERYTKPSLVVYNKNHSDPPVMLSLLKNEPDQLVMWLANMRARMLFASTPTTPSTNHVGNLINALNARVLLFPPSFEGHLPQVIPEYTSMMSHPEFRPGFLKSTVRPTLRHLVCSSWETRGPVHVPLRDLPIKDPIPNFLLPVVEGTPAEAPGSVEILDSPHGLKVLLYSQGDLIGRSEVLASALEFTEDERLLNTLSWSTVEGQTLGSLAVWNNGGTLINPSPVVDPLVLLKSLAEEKVTTFVGSVETYKAVLDHPSFSKYDLSVNKHIIVVSPSKLSTVDSNLIQRIRTSLKGNQIFVAVSIPEAGGISFVQSVTSDELKKDILGNPLEGISYKATDGELSVRGVGVPSKFHNYLNGGTNFSTEGYMPTGVQLVSNSEGGLQLKS